MISKALLAPSPLLALLILFALRSGPVLAGSATDIATLLLEAHEQGRKIPLVSQSRTNLGVEEAYEVQREYIKLRLRSDRIAGFKAGLTSKAAQQRFAVDTPLSGVLFASGKLSNHGVLYRLAFEQPMLEIEIGFVAGQSISKPLGNDSQLRTRIRGFVPVVEVPDVGFTNTKKLKGVDIIAANVSAAQFIVGQESTWNGVDLNKIAVTLERDGKVVNRGRGSDALGDQWHAALWLVNATVEQGWTIEAGSVLITGALGKLIPAAAGKYVAHYSTGGTLRFEIK